MKAVFNRARLAEAFARAALFVPSRSPSLIAHYVKMTATQDATNLMATNFESSIRTGVPDADVERDGTILLPADRLGAFLRECGGEHVTVESKTLEIAVKSDHGLLRLGVVAAEEFQDVPEFSADSQYSVTAQQLKRAISCAGNAGGECADERARSYSLSSVYFEFQEGQLFVVSTNGAFASSSKTALASDCGTPAHALLMPHMAKLLGRALPDSDSEVLLAAGPNTLSAKCDDTVIHSRQCEGRYPEWRRMFPQRPRRVRLSINAGYLRSAVRQASIVQSEESTGIFIEFSRNTLRLQMAESQRGESTVDIPVSYDGPNVKAKMSFRYLDSALRSISEQELVTLDAVDQDNPLVIEADGGNTTHVIQIMSLT